MKQRTITAIVIIAIFVPVLLIGGNIFKIFVLLISLLGLKELLTARESKNTVPDFVKLLAYSTLAYVVMCSTSTIEPNYLIDYRTIALLAFVFLIPILIYNNSKKYNFNDGLFLMGSVLLLGLSFNLLILLRENNYMILIYLILITVMTDTYAYLGGSLIGKHKLIEEISPKKSWEGLIIGTVFGVLISSVFYYIAITDNVNIFLLIAVTTFLSLIGQFGDLIFSSIKRLYNRKDFSDLMPGHGGILDRLDSFIFIVLGYVIIMFII
ncbi:MAG: phosphatidate cytidylyltransferase [Bacilli bacterium]|nr:phosphatidate cytidylyltransferase [Bacilli bacterium]